MRLHRFFIEDYLRNKKDLDIFDDELIHQWKDVFRLRVGDKVILLDNTGFEYLAEITLVSKGKASIKVLQTDAATNIPKKEIWLYAALIKKDNYEWILEKCTELGVTHFVPAVSERSEKKDINRERSLKILKEASEQSGRGLLPTLHEVVDLKTALDKAVNPVALHFSDIAFDEKARSTEPLSLFIGPEGGWSDREIELFKNKNVALCSLGNQILRAETAAIAASALILLEK